MEVVKHDISRGWFKAGAWASRLKYVWFGTHPAHGPAATQPSGESDVRVNSGPFSWCWADVWTGCGSGSFRRLVVCIILTQRWQSFGEATQTELCGQTQCDFSKKAGSESTCKNGAFVQRTVQIRAHQHSGKNTSLWRLLWMTGGILITCLCLCQCAVSVRVALRHV